MTQRASFRFLTRVLGPAAVLSACAFEEEPLDGPIRDEAQPFPVSGYYFWRTGDPSVFMGDATSNYFCTLSTVGGPFYGSGEEVRVTRSPVIGQPGQYRWYLTGNAVQPNVHAYAFCARYVDGYTGETQWSQGDDPEDLGPADDRVCFLSRIRGHFMGNGEQVRVRKSNGRWLLDGASQQEGVRAGARCVYASPDYVSSLQYTTNGGSGDASLLIGGNFDGTPNSDFCGLTQIRGQLDVGAVAGVWPTSGKWYVKVGPDTPGPLAVGARCLFHEIIVP